jgi:uncharacterized protein YxjI
LRYHVSCTDELGDSGWSIEPQSGPRLAIDDSAWDSSRTFSLGVTDGRVPTTCRITSTWRHHHCDIYRGEERIVHISTTFLADIRAKFVGEVPGPDVLAIRGCFIEQHYRFLRCQRTVASVSTVWDGDGGGFAVEIRDNEDQLMVLACAVGIRALCGAPKRACTLSLQPIQTMPGTGRLHRIGAQG